MIWTVKIIDIEIAKTNMNKLCLIIAARWIQMMAVDGGDGDYGGALKLTTVKVNNGDCENNGRRR